MKKELLKRLSPSAADALVAYVTHGQRPGGFWSALLSGDWHSAARRADDRARVLPMSFWADLMDTLPFDCYGSTEAFEGWIKKGGTNDQTR